MTRPRYRTMTCEHCGKVYRKAAYLVRHQDEFHYYPAEFGRPLTGKAAIQGGDKKR